MGKRSEFERNPRDFYPTPSAAVLPLLPHLQPQTKFSEPCAGDGILARHLSSFGHVAVWLSDLEPQAKTIIQMDVFSLSRKHGADVFITNPPWERSILHPLIQHLSNMAPTWLLFDADWAHTKQAIPLLPRLKKIVSIGRVKWIDGSKHTGKDNACWYLFDKSDGKIEFVGRTTGAN